MNLMLDRSRAISRIVRTRDWWYGRIPQPLAVAYAIVLLQGIAPLQAVGAVALLLVCLISLSVYGYLLNDAFDIKIDRLAGKPNAMAGRTPWQRLFIIVSLLIAGFLPWLLADLGAAALMVLVANYVIATIYSAPPLRLKERGIWGPITDALGENAVPVLFAATMFAHLSGLPHRSSLLLTAAATVWWFLNGLRAIFVHQISEHEIDLQSGVHTFVTDIGPARARRLVIWGLFPAELGALGVLTFAVHTFAPLLVYLFIAYGVIFQLARLAHVWNVSLSPIPNASDGYFVLGEFFAVWPALTLAVFLVFRHPLFCLLLLLHVALYHRGITKGVCDLIRMIHGLVKRLCAKGRF